MAGSRKPNILALHGEKLALGVFVLASAAFVYLGLQQENYQEKLKPEALKSLAEQVKTSIDQDHWDNLKDERVVETEFGARVEEARKPISTALYTTEAPWEYRGKAIGVRREAPELVPPQKPHMVGVLAAIAKKSDEEVEYPLLALEDADPLKKPPRSSKRQNRRGEGGDGGYPGYPGGSSGGAGMGGPGFGMGGEGEDDDGGEGLMGGGGLSGGMGGGYPGPGAGQPADKTRRFNAKYNLGFDALKIPATLKEFVAPETVHFIAGTALVPHRQLAEAYDLAFENAKGGNAMRDQPKYWEYEVQRADITDKAVDQLTEDDWKTVVEFKDLVKYREEWAGEAADVVPLIYADQQLTMPIPPVMMVDTAVFAVHPDLPMTLEEQTEAEGTLGSGVEDGDADRGEADGAGEADGEGDEGSAPGSGQGAGAGGPPSLGGPPGLGGTPGAGAGYGGYGGYGGGMGEPGRDGPGMSGPGMSGPGMSGPGMSGPGMSGPGMSGPGMSGPGMGSPGMGGGYPGYGSAGPVGRRAKYKQVRFYDFVDGKNPDSPKVGRIYVYRVRVALEDPNFPFLPNQQPQLRYLSPEVYASVMERMRKAEETKVRDPKMWTDWSEPSDPAALPDPSNAFVGPVAPPSIATTRIGDRRVEYSRQPPEVQLVASKWVDQWAAPAILTVSLKPGAVVSGSAVANVVDPLTLKILKSEKELKVTTDKIVLDAVGGEKFEQKSLEDLTTPGYVLMFSADGEIEVQSDIGDMDMFRAFSFADEREAAEKASSNPGAGSGYPGGYPGMGDDGDEGRGGGR